MDSNVSFKTASQPLLKELWLGLGQLPRNAGATGIEMANSFRFVQCLETAQ